VGRGTSLKVYLPKHGAPHVAESRETSVAVRLTGTETVLLVDDDDQVRHVAREVLRKSGYNVLEARNPGEALLTCEQYPQPIHLLLTDVVMPQMSGVQLAERLMKVLPDLRVLFMSGFASEAVLRHGLIDSGLGGFLQKPVTPEGLLAKARLILDARPAAGV
jgi:CheY-like chemotaxis protein